VHVSGTQTLVQAPTEYRMHGDLIGDWTMAPLQTLFQSKTLYVESGVERFVGCIDRNRNKHCGRREPSGELRFAYLYWVSFGPNQQFIKGQCVHPVTGGNKDFKGARGLINMYDRPKGDEVLTTYKGKLSLNAVPSDAPLAPFPTPPKVTAQSFAARGC
jgi:hypothetical protein